MEQELLRQRVAQDERFHATQLQKQKKAMLEAKDIQKFYQAQIVSMLIIQYIESSLQMCTPTCYDLMLTQEEKHRREEIEMLEEHNDWQRNMDLLKLEEKQFQEHAEKSISDAKERNAPTYPLIAAAKAGAG